MRSNRLLRLAIPVAGAVILAAGAIAVTASAAGLGVGSLFAATPTPTPKPSAATSTGAAACQAFLGHLAGQLNVSSSKLDTAALAAAKQTIQDQVTAGKLTQAQADKIEARLSSGSLCALGRAGDAGGAGTRAGLATRDYLAAAASALGVSEAQLLSDLKGGQTLSQVAAAQGVSEDQFKSRVVASLKPKLDAAVTAGKLTQAREDSALAKFQDGDPPLWNKARKGGASPTPTPAA